MPLQSNRPSFQATSKLPEWRELFQQTSAVTVGTTLTHEQLAAWMKLPKSSPRYFAQIQRWRKEESSVRHRQYRTVQGTGYELQPPQEHRSIAAGRVVQARRHIRRAHAVLQHTDMEQLTEMQRSLHITAEARVGALYQIAAATEKEVRYLPQAQPPKPLLESLK